MTLGPCPAVTDPSVAQVVVQEERLSVGTVRVPVERVVVRRRVVSEVRRIEVTVEREELEVVRLPLRDDADGRPVAAYATPRPVTVVLSEQVPVVQMRTRAYEQVTVSVEVVNDRQEVGGRLSREQVEVVPPAAGPAR